MTALKQYERLESEGLWRENSDAQRRDVLVSFGNATLVISDSAGRPLAHWSLPAVTRLNEGERPALFAADETADETLELSDPLMIEAIEKVRKTLLKSQPHPGRLRHVLIGGSVIVAILLAIFWFPGAALRQTLSVVPQSKRLEIGATILGHLQTQVGQRCQGAHGQDALAQLNQRLWGSESSTQIIVLPRGIGTSKPLPGGLILLNQDVVEQVDDPSITAGYALAAHATSIDTDPLADVLITAGLKATIGLLTTGDIAPEHLKTHADALVTTTQNITETTSLTRTFELAGVPLGPYFAHVGIESAVPYIQYDYGPILSDNAWIGLQGICDN